VVISRLGADEDDAPAIRTRSVRLVGLRIDAFQPRERRREHHLVVSRRDRAWGYETAPDTARHPRRRRDRVPEAVGTEPQRTAGPKTRARGPLQASVMHVRIDQHEWFDRLTRAREEPRDLVRDEAAE